MAMKTSERRKFRRYPVESGLIFSDRHGMIGPARVTNISCSGVQCISLSPVVCPLCWIDGIELFDPSLDIDLSELKGRMVRCSDNLTNGENDLQRYCYVFGFEFGNRCYQRISMMNKLLQKVIDPDRLL